MIEDRPIDLPRTGAWHSIVITSRRGLVTRYWLRCYDLNYQLEQGELLVQGSVKLLKTRNRVTTIVRSTPKRLRRIWEIQIEYQVQLMGAYARDITEEFVNAGLDRDLLLNQRTVGRVLDLALNEIQTMYDRLEPLIVNRPRLEVVREV